MTTPKLVYKIVDAAVFGPAMQQGTFAGAGIDMADGYIHFSTAAQLPETLRLHFAGEDNLALVAVRTADLGESLKWEPSRGGDLFPHLYGTLPMSAVAWTATIAVAPDGSVDLPADVR